MDYENDPLPDDYINLAQAEMEQLMIDTYYPGIELLTANEVALFADPDLDTLHKYQLHIALRRRHPEWYNDKSKIIGCTIKEIEENFGGTGQT